MVAWLREGHTAVITGGANGIGYAAAETYLRAGMNVVLADIAEEALTEAESTLSASGQLVTQACDVTDYAQLTNLREIAYDKFGRVDCLMNNAGAGITRAKPWNDVEGWKKQLDINLWGIIHGCQAFVPKMMESASAVAVINTGSKQGLTNPPGGFAYNLSKAGVINYTQSLSHALREEEGCPVSAHLLIPGFTYTNMIARFVPQKPESAWTSQEVIDFMLSRLGEDDFYIVCPDHDTPRTLDELRIQWNTDDLIKNRPALSRWHPDYADAYNDFVTGEN